MQQTIATAPVAPEHEESIPEALERLGTPLVSRRRARERRLAHDLVELSRLDRGLERAEPAAVDLALLLRAAIADYAGLALLGPPSARIDTDSRRLARVLFVLLDNAHLHGAPQVTLRYDEDSIVVADEGPGFPPNVLARAAEPFVTGRGSDGRGVGLGLAIARRQAALLGADLLIGNGPSGGAAVELRFAPALAIAG